MDAYETHCLETYRLLVTKVLFELDSKLSVDNFFKHSKTVGDHCAVKFFPIAKYAETKTEKKFQNIFSFLKVLKNQTFLFFITFTLRWSLIM